MSNLCLVVCVCAGGNPHIRRECRTFYNWYVKFYPGETDSGYQWWFKWTFPIFRLLDPWQYIIQRMRKAETILLEKNTESELVSSCPHLYFPLVKVPNKPPVPGSVSWDMRIRILLPSLLRRMVGGEKTWEYCLQSTPSVPGREEPRGETTAQ